MNDAFYIFPCVTSKHCDVAFKPTPHLRAKVVGSKHVQKPSSLLACLVAVAPTMGLGGWAWHGRAGQGSTAPDRTWMDGWIPREGGMNGTDVCK